jgi:hypothetical protein
MEIGHNFKFDSEFLNHLILIMLIFNNIINIKNINQFRQTQGNSSIQL